MWYRQPAEHFTQSLPLGNGRLGMMVFGGVEQDRVVLNEESVWSGSPTQDNRPDAYKQLPEIRRLLRQGRNVEAEQLVNKTFTCQGKGSGHGSGANVPFGCYQVLGNLRLKFNTDPNTVTEYRRELDLRSAVAQLSYKANDVTFRREYFVSAPDQVAAVRLTADKRNALGVSVALDRPERATVRAVDDNTLLMMGQLSDGQGGGGVRYVVRVRVVSLGGQVTAKENRLQISGADEVLLLIAGETDYQGNVPRQRVLEDPATKVEEVVSRAMAKPYAKLLSDHKADYRRFFNRVSLTLGDGSDTSRKAASLPTDRRLAAFSQGGSDPALAALYFNYARYLLISSSRPGTLPANLQGIWAEEIQTPWNGDYHLDINVQMNYWIAEVAALGDCHVPLLKLIESLQAPGGQTARAYYILQCERMGGPCDYERVGFYRPRGTSFLGRHDQRLGLALRTSVGTLHIPSRQRLSALGISDHEGLGPVLPGHAHRRTQARLARHGTVQFPGKRLSRARRQDRPCMHGACCRHATPARTIRQLHRRQRHPRH